MSVKSGWGGDHAAASIVENRSGATGARTCKTQSERVADALIDPRVKGRLNGGAAARGLVFSRTIEREHLIHTRFAVRLERGPFVVVHTDLLGGGEVLIAG